MKTLQVQQGSSEWAAERARRFTASEAPAMMGASKFQTRAELLRQKATGIVPEVDAATQRRFDAGHATEAAARALLEQYLGDLFPVTAVHDTDDRLLASVDGITLDDSTLFEHKLWSESLAAQVNAGDLDAHYFWQLEHQLLVTGAERVIFVTSDGTRERWAQMEYRPIQGRREALLAGWRQFDADLAAYIPPAAAVAVVAAPVQALPTVLVQVSGAITITDNFAAFETALRDFLEHRLIREPKTDQDFADLGVQIKAMKGAEAALEGAEVQMLAQIQTVDQAKKTKDMLAKLVRDNRLMAEKMLSSEKERRRGEIVAGGVQALQQFVAGLNKRLGSPFMPATATAADFGGAIRGKSSLASMEDAVASTLANAKIAASAIADGIETNLRALPSLVGDRAGLTPDLGILVLKGADDFSAVVGQRVAAQKASEERRAAELAEQQRAKIAAEERAKLEREQQQEAARAAEAAKPALPPAAAPIAPPAPVSQAAAPSSVVPIRPTSAPASAPTLKLGQINERIAPLSIDAAGLAALGFTGTKERGAVLFHEAQFPHMLSAMVRHLEALQAREAA